MRKQLLIISTLFIFSTNLFALNVDSLINVAAKLNGLEQATAYEKIGQHYYDQDYIESAKEYFKRSFMKAQAANYPNGQMSALRGLLRIAYFKEDSTSLSIEYAARIEGLSVEHNNTLMKAYVLHHYARTDKENKEKSLERYTRALQLFQETGKKESMGVVYKELGEAYLDTLPDMAYQYFQKNLGIATDLGKQDDIHLARSNMSTALIAMGQYKDARKFCARSIELAEATNDQDFLAYNYLLTAVSYKKEKDYLKAIEFADKGKLICEANNLMNRKQYTYQLLKEIYNERGNYQEAFDFFKKEKQIEEAIAKRESAEKVARVKAESKLQSKLKEIKSQEQVDYYKNMAKNAGLIFFATLAGILYMFNAKRKLKVQLQKEELEKLKVEQMLETEERERLKERLGHKERELASNTMFLIQKNQMLTDLKEKIKGMKNIGDENVRKQVNSLDRNITMNMDFDNDWEKFRLHFNEVHPNFFEKIRNVNKALNPNETRLCAYIRMDLATKEIAQLSGISPDSVQKNRYRLKKKLGLDKSINLIDFIRSL